MLERQTTWIEEKEDDEDDEEQIATDAPATQDRPLDGHSSNDTEAQGIDAIAGFCGRSGKIADTCYCFWNVGALTVSCEPPTRVPITPTDNWADPREPASGGNRCIKEVSVTKGDTYRRWIWQGARGASRYADNPSASTPYQELPS